MDKFFTSVASKARKDKSAAENEDESSGAASNAVYIPWVKI